MPLDNTPVLIGAGQFTYRGDPLSSPSPLDLLKTAAERAVADAGLGAATLQQLDAVHVVGFTLDSPGGRPPPYPRLANPPAALARAVGAQPRRALYTHMGGNSPQQLVNATAEAIAEGETSFALLAGAEFLGSLRKRLTSGKGFDDWAAAQGEAAGEEDAPERFGDPRQGATPQETAHGLNYPVNAYPLFENALRAHLGRSIPAHQRAIGELFAPFSQVAAGNPHAWFPRERSAEELITVSPGNRMISFPYPKFLNAIMEVDQSAAVLMCSYATARELGVADDRMVWLHGCGDAHDLWHVLDRQNYYSSPAMRGTGERALGMAGKTLADMDAFDLYSCFPVAVEIGAQELGLALDDPRGLTLTGGLPYAGGPGNNYVMHSIAAMMDRLRGGGREQWGLVTGNGWYLTKQSTGVYSTAPVEVAWEREDPKVLQAEINALPHPEIVERPEGEATIETYTVMHEREGYRNGIVIGRDSAGRRFVARTGNDPAVLAQMEATEQVGRKGTVRAGEGLLNQFEPA